MRQPLDHRSPIHPSTWEKGCFAKFASRILHCNEVLGEAVLGVLSTRVF
jgi:hypothetical protein